MKLLSADIAKQSDYTVVALVRGSPHVPREYALTELSRWRSLRYGQTVDKLVAAARQHPDATIVVDAGGVGRPVLDLVRDALPGRKIYGITSTGGRNANPGQQPGDISVPKADLIGVLQVLLQAKRLFFHPKLALLREIQGELQRYEAKLTAKLNTTFEGASGSHDDIVSALALACWMGENLRAPLTDADIANAVWSGYDEPERKPAAGRVASILDDLGLFAGD